MRGAIWWIKRDFRISDNPALRYAAVEANWLLPLVIIEDSIWQAPDFSLFHARAIRDAALDLDTALQTLQSKIFFARGEPVDLFENMRRSLGDFFIVSHQETGNALSFERDQRVRRWCRKHDISFFEPIQTGVFRGLKSRNERDHRWRDFIHAPPSPTPRSLPPLPVSPCLTKLRLCETFECPLSNRALDNLTVQPVSRNTAETTLDSFLATRGLGYSGGISSPNTAFTVGSRLSIHLAWGTLSVREVYHQVTKVLQNRRTSSTHAAAQWSRSLRAFLSRLHWRDHFIQRLESEPEMETRALHLSYEDLEYDNSPALEQALWAGQTGFPLIDACVRCLQETGFLNFRMRAMLVSFACHTLSISWKQVHPPLARLFYDYEPGIHLSQIQMQAGVVGINTVRVYSPLKQLRDHDPSAKFVKRWVPELRDLPTERIHSGEARLHPRYPIPVVDYTKATTLMKARLFSIRNTKEANSVALAVYDKHGSRKRPPRRRKKKGSISHRQLNLFGE